MPEYATYSKDRIPFTVPRNRGYRDGPDLENMDTRVILSEQERKTKQIRERGLAKEREQKCQQKREQEQEQELISLPSRSLRRIKLSYNRVRANSWEMGPDSHSQPVGVPDITAAGSQLQHPYRQQNQQQRQKQQHQYCWTRTKPRRSASLMSKPNSTREDDYYSIPRAFNDPEQVYPQVQTGNVGLFPASSHPSHARAHPHHTHTHSPLYYQQGYLPTPFQRDQVNHNNDGNVHQTSVSWNGSTSSGTPHYSSAYRERVLERDPQVAYRPHLRISQHQQPQQYPQQYLRNRQSSRRLSNNQHQRPHQDHHQRQLQLQLQHQHQHQHQYHHHSLPLHRLLNIPLDGRTNDTTTTTTYENRLLALFFEGLVVLAIVHLVLRLVDMSGTTFQLVLGIALAWYFLKNSM